MNQSRPPRSFDGVVAAARDALSDVNFPCPDALVLSATGVEPLLAGSDSTRRLILGELPGVPVAWSDIELCAGKSDGTNLWFLLDNPDPVALGCEAAWARAFPVWLAATMGAGICVTTTAGVALPTAADQRLAPGTIALVKDHVNLSGRTPLTGLGESYLGPLFPDQTRLHHEGLRAAALRLASEHGLTAAEAVLACTAGPALLTPAERRWLATTGADVAVEDSAASLIASAHAGLAALALVAVVDGDGTLEVEDVLAEVERIAPSLEELLTRLLPVLGVVAGELAEEA